LSVVITEKAEMIRNYICAVLRVVSEKHTDGFVDVAVFAQIAKVLTVETSRYVQVLLLELCYVVVSQFHFFFLTKVITESSFISAFGVLARSVLSDDSIMDVQEAMCKLISKICEMELLTPQNAGGQSFASQCLELEFWKPLLVVSPGAARAKLTTLRWIITACTSHRTVEHLRRAMPNLFPSFALVLNSNQTTPDPLVDSELALILGIALAKHPSIRSYVRDTLMQYPVWCEQLRIRMRMLVSGLSHEQLCTFDIIDFRSVVLNNPEDMPGVVNSSHIDFSNIVMLEGVTLGMLQQQAFNPLVRSNPPPVTIPLINGVDRRKAALTQAVLCAALNLAMQDPEAYNRQAVSVSPLKQGVEPSPALQMRHRHILTPAYFDSTPTKQAAEALPLETSPMVLNVTPKGLDKRKQWMMHGKGIFGPKADASPGIRTPFKPASPCRPVFSEPAHTTRTDFTPRASNKLGSTPRAQVSTPGLLNPSSSEADYIDVAILMHLPITFGAHYNRVMREPTCRIMEGPNGPVVQAIHKSTTQQTWTIQDVTSRDLFRFFIPFHKISESRIDAELERLRKHTLRTKKQLLMTPATKRTRRWFLHDLMNYILPKTEGILLELKDVVTVHGEENFVFALSMVRLMDQGKVAEPSDGLVHVDEDLERYRQDMVLQEVLRLSVGRYKDVIHSGNVLYALDRVKRYFAEQVQAAHMEAASRPQHLQDIENEIRHLEQKAMADRWDNDNAEDEDDVEDEHQESDDEEDGRRFNREMDRMRRTPDPDAVMTDLGDDMDLAIPKALLREANLDAPPPYYGHHHHARTGSASDAGSYDL
jgi:hypothetical protein